MKQQDFRKKARALEDEYRTAEKLIKFGLAEFQNIGFDNDFYFLPFRLLSDGLERFMKCFICSKYFDRHQRFPQSGDIWGHDLKELKNTIVKSYFQKNNVSIIQEDLLFVSTEDNDLDKILSILSDFGDNKGRYYNLDIITERNTSNTREMWEQLENEIAQNNGIATHDNDTYYQEIYKHIVIVIEKFVRALVHQFTYFKLTSEISVVQPDYCFIQTDSMLGTRNYNSIREV